MLGCACRAVLRHKVILPPSRLDCDVPQTLLLYAVHLRMADHDGGEQVDAQTEQRPKRRRMAVAEEDDAGMQLLQSTPKPKTSPLQVNEIVPLPLFDERNEASQEIKALMIPTADCNITGVDAADKKCPGGRMRCIELKLLVAIDAGDGWSDVHRMTALVDSASRRRERSSATLCADADCAVDEL